tara:strand:+ start:15591 stop:16271 length:681 start_codon:yes stop_codon:yes gene_type:complete
MSTSEANVPGRVSVVIPLFNGAEHITAALDSVFAQQHADIEVIVVDDGSLDDGAARVRAYPRPVRLLSQENSGSGVARNSGVAAASGEWLAFLDADDLWAEGKLALQLAAFEEQPELDIVWGHVTEFVHGMDPMQNTSRPLAGGHPGTALMRMPAFARSGGFAHDLAQCEVVDWVSRVVAAGLHHTTLDAVLMYRRLHARNKGRLHPGMQRQYLQALKRHLDRQRS